MLFTVYEEEPDGLAGAVEGGEVGDVVRVGGDEHHVRGVRVAPRLEEGEVAGAAIMRIHESLSRCHLHFYLPQIAGQRPALPGPLEVYLKNFYVDKND